MGRVLETELDWKHHYDIISFSHLGLKQSQTTVEHLSSGVRRTEPGSSQFKDCMLCQAISLYNIHPPTISSQPKPAMGVQRFSPYQPNNCGAALEWRVFC